MSDNKDGFNHQAHLDNGVNEARVKELKEKAFEIYKGFVIVHSSGTDEMKVAVCYKLAEAFLNYEHKN